MAFHLHEFVPTFTLYLNVEDAQKLARKQFKETNIDVWHYFPIVWLSNVIENKYRKLPHNWTKRDAEIELSW